MIIDDIKNDLRNALRSYSDNCLKSANVPLQRARDLEYITQLVSRLDDPCQLCSQINDYIEKTKLPILNWLSFLDSSRFYWAIKNVLLKSDYSEVNILKKLLQEKDIAVSASTNHPINIQSSPPPEEIAVMMEDIKLMRMELIHVYDRFKQLSETVANLEQQSQINLARAQRAEAEVERLKARLGDADKQVGLSVLPGESHESASQQRTVC